MLLLNTREKLTTLIEDLKLEYVRIANINPEDDELEFIDSEIASAKNKLRIVNNEIKRIMGKEFLAQLDM